MNPQHLTTENKCLGEEISLYLDGELSPSDELKLEQHLAVCKNCSSELILQKQMLTALNIAFEKKFEIEPPKDFSKVVIVRAESSVKGLRSKKERSLALYLSFGLLLIFAIGFVAESHRVYGSMSILGNQILVLAEFIFHLAYNISFGLAVILRNLSQQIIYTSGFTIILLTLVMLVSILTLPRLVIRLNRAKTS